MAISDVRDAIANAIDSAEYNTFSFPPDAPVARSVAIAYGEPMIEPMAIGKSSYWLNLTIQVFANAVNNQSEIKQIEDMVMTVLELIPTGVQLVSVSAPDEFTTASAAFTRAIISIRVPIENS